MKTGSRIGWILAVIAGAAPLSLGAKTPPTVVVSPDEGRDGSTLTLLIQGYLDTFLSLPCELRFSPATRIVAGPVEFAGENAIQVAITIPKGTTPGMQTLILSCAGLEFVVPNAFEVLGLASLVSVVPGSGYLGEQVHLTIVGEYTRFDASSRLKIVPADLTVQSLSALSPTRLEATLVIPAIAATSVHQLTVLTGAQELGWAQGFAVKAVPLILLPRQALQGQQLAAVSLTGEGCQCQSVTAVSLGEGIAIGSFQATSTSAIALSAVAIAENGSVGRRDLTLTYPSGPLVYDNLFVVQQGPKTRLLSISPDHADAGHPGLRVTLTGQNTHLDNPEPRARLSGTGAALHPQRSSDPTRLVVNAVISESTVQGKKTLTVDVPGACEWAEQDTDAPCEQVALTDGFTVTQPGVLQSLSPASPLEPGTTPTVTLQAADGQFVADSTRLVVEPAQGVEVTSLQVLGADQLQAALVIAADASGLPRTLKAVTGSEVAIGTDLLDIYHPAIESIIPGSGVQGAAALSLVIQGIDVVFDASATVSFGAGIAVSALSVDPALPGRLQVTVAIDETAEVGAREVTVQAGALTLTAAQGFKVFRLPTPDENGGGGGGGCSCAASAQPLGWLGAVGLGCWLAAWRRRRALP